MDSAMHMPVSLIDPNPHQPLQYLSTDDISELTASILANGIIEPLVVCPNGEWFTLIARYRWLTAEKGWFNRSALHCPGGDRCGVV